MNAEEILLLTPREIQGLLSIDECIVAVEHAFHLHGEGKAAPPGVLSMHTHDGGFHVKAGVLELSRPYFGAKVNGNFAENGKRFGLPTIQGAPPRFAAAEIKDVFRSGRFPAFATCKMYSPMTRVKNRRCALREILQKNWQFR